MTGSTPEICRLQRWCSAVTRLTTQREFVRCCRNAGTQVKNFVQRSQRQRDTRFSRCVGLTDNNLNKLQTMLYSGLTFETAWLLLTFCHVPAVDFLMAQLYPTCSAGPLAVFDAAVERCARVVLGGAGPAIFDHPLIRRRVRLP